MPPYRAKKTLPKGFRLTEGCIDPGTGYGDDRYGWILYRWQPITTGHLWWKKTAPGWAKIGRYWSWQKQDAIDYAWDTAEMLDQM